MFMTITYKWEQNVINVKQIKMIIKMVYSNDKHHKVHHNVQWKAMTIQVAFPHHTQCINKLIHSVGRGRLTEIDNL